MKYIGALSLSLLIGLLLSGSSGAVTWNFDTGADLEGWLAGGTVFYGMGSRTDLSVEDGILKMKLEKPRGALAGAGTLVSPRVELDTSLFDRVIVRVRVNEGIYVGDMTISWVTSETPEDLHPFAANAYATGTGPYAVTFSEEWQEIEVGIRKPSWTGMLMRFDLQFFYLRNQEDRSLPEEIWVDWITLTGPGEEVLGPSVVVPEESRRGSLFGLYEHYPMSNRPVRLCGADFDGDGRVDLAAASFGYTDPEGTVTEGAFVLLFNDGVGGFSRQRVYEVKGGATLVKASDLNGDGRLDLLVISPPPGDSILVLLNLMTFATGLVFPIFSSAYTWEFDTDGDSEGWRAGTDAFRGGGNYSDLTVVDGVLMVKVSHSPGTVPAVWLVSPTLNWDTGLFDRIKVRVRVSSGTATGSWGMHWLTTERLEGQMGNVAGPYTTNTILVSKDDLVAWSEDWEDFEITDLSKRESWKGQLIRFGITFLLWRGIGGGNVYAESGSFPEEIWIDSLTLTGPGEEILGSPTAPIVDVSTGTLFGRYSAYNMGYPVSFISGADFDRDGDIDLVTTGGEYPVGYISTVWMCRGVRMTSLTQGE